MTLLIGIIILAAVFDFINGFHDAANSIATVVTTRVLTPLQAVLWVAAFNFVAFFIAKYIIGEFGIADTVSKIVVQDNGVDILPIIFVALISSITCNLITWWFGIPSSSSHTLIGSLSGAGIAAAGFGAVHLETVGIIAAFILAAPLIGMIGGNLITILTLHLARWSKPHKADIWFKRVQLFSSATLSITHGLNDSQKEIGVIAAALISYNSCLDDPSTLPHWMQLTDIHDIHDCRYSVSHPLQYNHVRRLENHEDNGQQDYEDYSIRGILHTNSRLTYSLSYRTNENSGKYYARDYR